MKMDPSRDVPTRSEDTEVDMNALVSEHKFIGCFFTAPRSTPCLIWGSILKQLKHELNEGNSSREFFCLILPISTIDLESGGG